MVRGDLSEGYAEHACTATAIPTTVCQPQLGLGAGARVSIVFM
jgi:hypothetical protein